MDSDTDAPGGRRKFDPELERMLLEGEIFVEQTWLKLRLMADHWPAFESVPVRPRRTRITVGFDADMVDWFRLMGEGWHARINAVLRVFMLAVQSKEIHTDRDYDWRGGQDQDHRGRRRRHGGLVPADGRGLARADQRVLRVFMLAVQSKEIHTERDYAGADGC